MEPSQSALRIIPLGGLGEVGLNLMVVECGDDMMLIDCGLLFPDLSWLGLDLVLPDFSYVIERRHKLRGLVVTHAHEDHIGAIPFLLKKADVPIIYCGSFARLLLEDKCQEHHVLDKLLCHDVSAGDVHRLGCFEVEFVHVTHSTVQTFALAIRTPQGLVIHSGDFKFDETPYAGLPSDKKRLAELGKEDPILVLSDSTNSSTHGHTPSERTLIPSLTGLIKDSPGLVVVSLFASNVHRVQQIVDICHLLGRKVFLSGRSMERYVNIALQQNLISMHPDVLQSLDDFSTFERSQCLVLATGSQAQARSALQQLAHNENRHVKIEKGDTLILSSRNIPGNEKAVHALVNDFYRMGADVFYAEIADVHVSGHAARDEQLEFLKLTNPEHFIPIHGEPRQMILHQRTAEQSGCVRGQVHYLENGSIWEFDKSASPNSRILEEKANVGKLWVFQEEVGDFEDDRLRERKVAARAGAVSVGLLTNPTGDRLLAEPSLTFKGLLSSPETTQALGRQLLLDITEAFDNFDPHGGSFLNREEAVAGSVRKLFKRLLGLKPLVFVHVLKGA